MSDRSNPFSGQSAKTRASWSSGAVGWVLVAIIVALLLAFAGLWASAQRERNQHEKLRASLDDAARELATMKAKHAENQQSVAGLRARVAELEKEKEMAVQMARGLEDQMRAELESKDVTISKLQGRLTVNILDRILFDSGEAVVKPDGEAVLRKIASILTQHSELKVHVIGHTDNVPIRATARSKYASNWELSTARALAAVRFLTEQAGVSPQRLGAVGYGEFRPIADNATAEGRARNRRIAVTILADELAGADVVPGVPPVSNQPLPIKELPASVPENP
jgi:chemotaxis protein MotB